jgi:hypothetical protein
MELLDAHARRFAGGSLREERLAARAIALCEAGRTAEARGAAAQFFAEATGSPLEERVRAACKDAMPSAPPGDKKVPVDFETERGTRAHGTQ